MGKLISQLVVMRIDTILYLLLVAYFTSFWLRPKKQHIENLTKTKKDYSIIRPTPTHVTILANSPQHSDYHIDNADIQHYTLKRKNENDILRKYNRELRERGLISTAQHATENLDNYLINEILGNNLVNQPIHIQNPQFREYRDTQNVHDTNIQKQLKDTYNVVKDISKEPNRIFSELSVLQLAETLGKNVEKLKRIMTRIKSRNSSVINYNDHNEWNILQNTWKAGNDNVREQIINNLLDCEENGSVVCPTGTTSRIVESVFIDSPENMPKTKEMYSEEMFSKASAIRKELEACEEYTKLTQDNQTQALKEKILEAYHTDYNGILTPEQIQEYTQEWINYI